MLGSKLPPPTTALTAGFSPGATQKPTTPSGSVNVGPKLVVPAGWIGADARISAPDTGSPR